MRLIDADAFIEFLHNKTFVDGDDRSLVYAWLQEQPTIETERKARWVKILENCMNCEQTVSYICTSCGHMIHRPRPLRAYFSLPNFCEHCGANMSDNN